jgi:hypothetical protein
LHVQKALMEYLLCGQISAAGSPVW